MKKITMLCLALSGLNAATAQSWDWMFSTQSVEGSSIIPYSFATGITTDTQDGVYLNCISTQASMAFGSETFEGSSWAGRNFLVKLNNSGAIQWVNATAANATINTIALTTDAEDNLYSTGEFTVSYDFEGYTFSTGDMYSGINSFITKKDSNGTTLWAKHISITENPEAPEYVNRFIRAYDIITDAAGNIFICGQARGINAIFDGITLPVTGESDTFIAKYDSTGTLLWAKMIAENSYQGGRRLACDSAGNVYIAGCHEGDSTITFDDIVLGGNKSLSFIVKYSPEGEMAWVKSYTNNTTGLLFCYNIAIDADDNIYTVGYTDFNSITFGSTILTPSTSGLQYGWAVKHNADGDVLWAKSPTGGGRINDVQVGSDGYVYLLGSFYTPQMTFGTTTLTNQGGLNGFVAKLNGNGNYTWIEQIGGTAHSEAYMAVDIANSSLYVLGDYTNIKFGEETYTASPGELYASKFSIPALGTHNFDNHTQLLYPNPATGIIKITANAVNNGAPYKITDLAGRIVKEGYAGDEINVEYLPAGMYIYSSGTYSSKFIKE